jgi:hypothetical protein
MAETDEIETENFFDEPKETALAPIEETGVALTSGNSSQIMQQALQLSRSTIIPANFQGKVENCLIVVDFAKRTGFPALTVVQNLYIINGKPSWSSQFLIALINNDGRFAPLRFEYIGEVGKEDRGCRAVTTDIKTGEKLEGTWITMEMAKGEGWINKSGSKWKSMPEQMLAYRAAAFFARLYAPDIISGIRLETEEQEIINVTPPRQEESAAEKAWREQNEK